MKRAYILIAAFFTITFANSQSPEIIIFLPATGAAGTLITIRGTGLHDANSLKVGGMTGIIVSNTDSVLVGLVMPGATTGKVVITTAIGTVSSDDDFIVSATSFPSIQQGNKLVGTDAIGMSQQGFSVSISADGNTAVVGGINDNNIGAAWIFTRTGDIWTQQGGKLIGSDSTIYSTEGASVDISADGNTVIVGGPQCDNNIGAAWVFVRNGNEWTQQGGKLLGSGAIGESEFGISVSLSADGNTAMIGGSFDNIRLGAVWVFIRSGGIWTQQGNKLVGTGAVGMYSDQGISVDLSADGNTAIVGGYDDNSIGAVWVFTRSGDTWTQQGEKLVGTGTGFSSSFGYSVSISADGNTAIVGGPYDNNHMGAVWFYNRNGEMWKQQGEKITGTGAIGTFIHQGYSVSLSADGNTALVGGPDANNVGAAWAYTRSDTIWTQQGGILFGTGTIGPYISQGKSVSISADGNTAIIGADKDNLLIGAVWIFTSSVNTIVQGSLEEKDMLIYPNPTNNKIIFEDVTHLQDAEISIFNLQGKLLMQQQIQTAKAMIDLTKYPKGVYVIKVSNPEKMIVKRFVIQ